MRELFNKDHHFDFEASTIGSVFDFISKYHYLFAVQLIGYFVPSRLPGSR
ncbi:hypothetical protein [Mucilaginibacter segetis]|uniref:Uncharacterized protein n=1 Tax=Mucilaginibacter segetis TaxID=2793071 RepID=A0A934PS63_9SPHI|nr:hypothetical protein [Mucilaginibacter segetis]MBK0379804.1 hypothetical protein [Mucilaginibacter segetis]